MLTMKCPTWRAPHKKVGEKLAFAALLFLLHLISFVQGIAAKRIKFQILLLADFPSAPLSVLLVFLVRCLDHCSRLCFVIW
jgi:hypothetical protein